LRAENSREGCNGGNAVQKRQRKDGMTITVRDSSKTPDTFSNVVL
jgi:hypothetical protein